MESMTKEEMQRFLIKEAQRGSTEMEAYRNLMEILGIEFPIEAKKENGKLTQSHNAKNKTPKSHNRLA